MDRDLKKSAPRSPGEAIIAVLPLGRVGEDILRVVADSLQGILRLPVDLREPMPIPQGTFMDSRNQYNAMGLIKYLDKELAHSSLKILGITSNDICNPILTYVFGEAYMGGHSAVMSSARLKTGLLGEPISREHFLDRVVKVAIHEIGHTFNLRHCHTDRCVMRASNTLMELDEKLNYLCDYCEIFLFDSLKQTLKEQDSAADAT